MNEMVELVKKFSEVIKLEFGLEKCAVAIFEAGKLQSMKKMNNTECSQDEDRNIDSYKYL